MSDSPYGRLNASIGSPAPADTVLSEDGSTLYVAGQDGKVRVYDVGTRSLQATWDVGVNLGGMDISPAGDFLMVVEREPLATTSGSPFDQTTTVTVYKIDVATGAKTSFPITMVGFGGVFFDVAIGADGNAILGQSFRNVAGSGPLIWRLDVETGQYTNLDERYSGEDVTIWRNADGSEILIAASNDARVYLYEPGTGFTDSRDSFGSAAATSAISSAAGLIARADGKLSIYGEDLDYRFELSATLPQFAGAGIVGLAFDAAGANLYILDQRTDTISQVSTTTWTVVRTFAVGADVDDPSEVDAFSLPAPDGDYGNQLVVTPDSRYFIVATGSDVRIVENDSLANSVVGTDAADDLDAGTGDDLLSGLAGNDQLRGNAGNDTLDGGAGDDFIDGGDGSDTAQYRLASGGVTVSLGASGPQDTGGAGLDTLLSIESLVGSGFDDLLTGSEGDDSLDGYEGTDTLLGLGGNDALLAGNIDGTIDGGSGVDTLYYGASLNPVAVDLSLPAEQQVSASHAQTLSGIENVHGSSYDDSLSGSDEANELNGLAGGDYLAGRDGNDRLDGGDGDNELHGGAGEDILISHGNADLMYGEDDWDTFLFTAVRTGAASPTMGLIDGGAGFDTIEFGTASPVTFGLIEGSGGGQTSGLQVGSQVFQTVAVERMLFGGGDDIISVVPGFTDQMELRGRAGDDSFSLSGATDGSIAHGLVDGGDGNDLLKLGAGFTVNLGTETASGPGAGYRVLSFERVQVAVTGGQSATVIGVGKDEIFEVDPLLDDGSAGVTFEGNQGNDTLSGSAGDDRLDGGTGDDRLIGGAGSDTLIGDDWPTGVMGFGDIVDYSAETGTRGVIVNLSPESITVGSDVVAAGQAIDSFGDTDELRSIEIVRTGGLDDYINANNQFGSLNADPFNPVRGAFSTGAGNDTIITGAGGDSVDGGAGIDSVSIDWRDLTAGQAVVLDVNAAVNVTIGTGTDQRYLRNVEQLRELFTGAGNDVITMSRRNDLPENVITRGGDDSVYLTASSFGSIGGGNIADGINLGAGNDRAFIDYSAATTNVVMSTLTLASPDDPLNFEVAVGIFTNLYLFGVNHLSFATGSGADRLIGTQGNDVFTAGAGADSIQAGLGNDWLDGGTGSDAMTGGAGNDIYLVDNARDSISELSGEGTDTVRSSISHVLAANFENLILTGASATNGTGNSRANAITGNGKNNAITGGAGNDLIDGGGGIDTAVFSGVSADYRITRLASGELSVVGRDGSDRVVAVERLQFADGTFAASLFADQGVATKAFGASAAAGGWTDADTFPRTLGDINGDGLADIVGFGSAGVYVALANGRGGFGSMVLAAKAFGTSAAAGSWSDADTYPRILADINGDGRDDIVGFGGAGVYAALATTGGKFGNMYLATAAFGALPIAGGWTDIDTFPRTLADVNGDGRADIVGFGSAGVYVALAAGPDKFGNMFLATKAFGTSAAAGGWTDAGTYPRMLADVNGDGMADLIGFGSAGVYTALATGGGKFAAMKLAVKGFGAGPEGGSWSSQDLFPRDAADVNGDGYADLIGFGSAGVYIAAAKGDGTFAAPVLDLGAFGAGVAGGSWTSNDLFPRELADVNGDGLADIIGFGNAGVHVAVATDLILI